MFSGGPIERFSGGWAIIPFSGEMAHHWKQDGELGGAAKFVSPCGMVGYTSEKIKALDVGGFNKCKRCVSFVNGK